MPWPSTPRLCAQCGAELDPEAATVTLEDATSGEQRHLHQACFDARYAPVRAVDDQPDSETRRQSA